MKALLLAGVFFASLRAMAATPSTCPFDDPYSKALCAYQHRNFGEAESGFRAIVDQAAEDPQTIRAMYFLARTEMKQGKYDDASKRLIRIYSLDKAFYDTWACDYLLGECRRASGKDEG